MIKYIKTWFNHTTNCFARMLIRCMKTIMQLQLKQLELLRHNSKFHYWNKSPLLELMSIR